MGIGLDLEAEAKSSANVGGLPVPHGPSAPIMTIEALVSFGFKEWPVAPHDKHDRHWQYCVRDEKGKKLFVQVKFWQFSRYSSLERGQVHDSFSADCQFDMRGAKTFNVDCSVNDMTPKQVVEWFENMHTKLGCTYYELWSDEQYDEDGKKTLYNCEGCGKWLNPEEAVEPFMCPCCLYEAQTGFKKRNRK